MQNSANDLSKVFGKADAAPGKDFSRQNQVGILGVQICQAALNVFVSIFLVARILRITGGDFGAIGLFLLVQYIGIIVTFWLFSYIVKKFSRVWCIRVSTLFLLGSIILILLMQDNLAESYLLLSAVFGIGQGIYWCAILTFTSQSMGGKRMSGYAVWYIVLTSAVSALTPFTLGALIEFVSFEITILIALGFRIPLMTCSQLLLTKRKFAPRAILFCKIYPIRTLACYNYNMGLRGKFLCNAGW